MSELINAQYNERKFRRHLLTTASALALTLYVSSANMAKADDTDRPTVWIELGGQLEHITGQGDVFAPKFLSTYSTSSILQEKMTPLQAQQPPLFSAGEDAKVSFQPDDRAGWCLRPSATAAQVIKSMSNTKRTVHILRNIKAAFPGRTLMLSIRKSLRTRTSPIKRAMLTLDFMVGKDVGLGMFGLDGSSILSGGIRIAQFSSRSSVDMRARPDLHFKCFPSSAFPSRFCGAAFHTYHAYENASRNFHGIGPSIAWNGSARVAGNKDSGINFDWGANAALLFGRQRANVRHNETGHCYGGTLVGHCYGVAVTGVPYTVTYQKSGGHTSRKSVTVPNVGGFAGLSYRYNNAKISLGYRADFFFGAIDGGIDTRKSETLGFTGPFASVSVGLGG